MTKKITYPKELQRKLRRPRLGPFASDDAINKSSKEIQNEVAKRMAMLFQCHDVQPGNWMALCYALARTHITGFQIADGFDGPREKWTDIVRAELVIAVENTGLRNVVKATQLLATTEPWRAMVGESNGAERLRDEYNRADSRCVEVVRNAQLFDALPEEEKAKLLGTD